ncbi:MAG: amino acid ABC transporter ATP-binding protein [Eubacteriales bacterium]|nr:amino acid ABC transporter ATP-binding protein [Eubacteriales bacterium]
MIEVKNLKKSFGNNTVFQNVNLTVSKGDVVSIIGGSGCGKSTLLRCINRLEIPDSGSVLIDGDDIHAPGAKLDLIRRKLGMVYQGFHLFSHLNVMENMILAPMKVLKTSKKEAIALADELLENVGMQNHRFHMPDQLSGGQKQRVAIARAMAMRPQVMLFDEPTSALDPTMVDEVENVIRRLVDGGMTSIIVTHDMRFARNISSKVVFLAEQGVYETGAPEQVFDKPSRPLTRQFLYRARMFSRKVTAGDVDIYGLHSEIRSFASPYGFSLSHSRSVMYVCEELLMPLLCAQENAAASATLSFIASESGSAHTLLIRFEGLNCDPMAHPAIDELRRKLLVGTTVEIASALGEDGVWETRIVL